jgi:dienelactone hydrolase
MLPCGDGFAHRGLKSKLESRGDEIIEFSGTNQTEIYDGLVREVANACDFGKTIALHGWSMGGGILLKFLDSDDFKDYMYSIVAVFLYAAAGQARRALPDGAPLTILYHNINDSVIKSSTSASNVKTLGKGTILRTAKNQYSLKNHLCDEFIDLTLTDLDSCLLKHTLKRASFRQSTK